MNATTRKPKLAKIAGLGCSAAVALVVALGIIFWLIGTYAPEVEEPAAQEPAATAEADAPEPPEEPAEEPGSEPEPKAEPTEEPTEDPAPKPEPTTEPEPEAETTGEPEPAKTPEPEPTEEPAPEKKSGTAQAEEVQDALAVWYDDCTWDTTESDGLVTSNCAEHEIGIIVGPGEDTVQSILDSIGEESIGGGYFVEGGVAVWATDMGTVNKAWDAMGAPGTPTQF